MVILAAALLVASAGSVQAQTGSIEGTVTDAATGEPLPGVNVVVVETNQGSASDEDGNFEIEGIQPGTYTLAASFVGFATATQAVEVASGATTTVNFAIVQEATELDEVVAIGYGAVQRRDVTGAVSSITSADLENLPIRSMDQALQGLSAGTFVKNTTGGPGGGISIRIRGAGSVTGGNEPLFVIDGMPIVNDLEAVPGTANPMATINPDDIESIQVLKDASATAIYGSRGSNGVVIIETKQGTRGRTSVNFSSSVGFSQTERRFELLSGPEYVQFANEAAEQRGVQDYWPNEPSSYPTHDWQDLIYRNGLTQDYNLSVSGGDSDTRFNVSGNFFDDEGIVRNSSFRRYSMRLNFLQDVSNDFRVQANVTATRGEYESIDFGHEGVTELAIWIPPNLAPYEEDGSFTNWSAKAPDRFENPLAKIEAVDDDSRIHRVLGNAQLGYDLTDNLELRVKVGADLEEFKRDQFQSRRLTLLPVNGNAEIWNRRRVNVLNENLLEFNEDFGDHSLNVLGGFTYQSETDENTYLQNANFITEATKTDAIEAGAQEGGPSVNSGFGEWTLMSYLGRVNYNIFDRYLLTFTARADGSSKFGSGNKWGFFPSAAFAWRLGDERWFRTRLPSVSDLKFRVSYGRSGNQQIGTYASLAQLSTVNYLFGGPNSQEIVGYVPSQVENPDLKWETSDQLDVGLDLGLWNQKLRFTADVYRKETTGLILPVTLPINSGFDVSIQNTGTVLNKGIELSLDGAVFAGDFSWQTGVNWSANRNEVLDLGESDEFWGASVVPGDVVGSLVREGEPIGMFWGLETDGIINTQAEADELGYGEPGDIRFVDQDGDGAIGVGDRTIIGNPHPDFVYGWINTFSYKGWMLNAFIQGTQGNDLWNGNMEANMIGTMNVLRERFENRWTPETAETATYPRAGIITQGAGNGREGRFIIQDGSYLRLKTLTLSYTLPASMMGWAGGLSRARIYVQGQNLFTITDYMGLNPDVDTEGQDTINSGFDKAAYPTVREIAVGINLTF